MSQLHFYVPDEVERQLRERAKNANMPLSRYLSEIVKQQAQTLDRWPEGYFEQVFGQWQGEPLRRESEGEFEQRPGIE